jgi:cytoskeletal protein RodZ
MPLNDLIKEYSLQTLSDKTNISINSLEKLQKREWDKLQKTQVVGFLKILEREYNINLDELRAEAENFYKEHTTKESNNPIDVVGVANVKSESKFVSGFITLVTLAVLAYTTWYYFAGHKIDSQEDNNESNKSGMFDNTLESVKELIGMDGNTPTENALAATVEANNTAKDTNNSNENSIEAEKKENTTTNTAPVAPVEAVENSAASNSTAENTKFNTVAAAATSEAAVDNNSQSATAVEANSNIQEETTSVSSSNETVATNSEANNSVESETQESIKETAVATADKVESTDNNVSEESPLNNSEVNNSELIKDPTEAETTAVKIEKIAIKPLSKRLWLGIYNLDSKKRVNKFITSEIELPVTAKLAVITGHNRLEIKTESGDTMRFKNKGRVYLLVSQEGIKEITKSEYKQFTKNRAW